MSMIAKRYLSTIPLSAPYTSWRSNVTATTVTGATKVPPLLFKAIERPDHFIITDEISGKHFEVTFAWLRDHCR